MPFFSLIVPVYNRENLVGETIESVLAQDFEDFELLLVDDGSSDASLQALHDWSTQDARIRVIALPENEGRCAARNKGLEAASAPWICYLDSDDVYYSDHLSTMHALILTHPEQHAFATDLDVNEIKKAYHDKRLNKDLITLDLHDFIHANPLIANQLTHKRDLPISWSRNRITLSEDWLFLRELTLHSSILKKAKSTSNLREHEGRSMNTSSAEDFVKYNQMSAEEFLQNPNVPSTVRKRIEVYTVLLCANVYLSDRKKRLALPLFKKSLGYWRSYTHSLFYKAIIKFLR